MHDGYQLSSKLFNKLYGDSEPLREIRVLDLTHFIFGPMISEFLALFGAEVIKVEAPDEGDRWRLGPYWWRYWKDSNLLFHHCNANKLFIAVDLKKPKGRDLILKLASISDVVVENFRAGLAEAWGIGYSQVSKINPKVIYVSCSGYGQWGPLKYLPSFDLIAQSVSGVALKTGFPGGKKYKLQDYYGDYLPALVGAVAVMAALIYREKTGRGQYIDIAQAECMMRIMHDWTYLSITGEDLGCSGNVDPTMAPSGIFKTSDGKFIALAIATDEQFLALMKAMGRNDLAQDKRFQETLERLRPENAAYINKIVEEWIKTKKATEVIELANEYGFPASEVVDDWQIINEEWRKERRSIGEVEDHMYGRVVIPIFPATFEKTPAKIKWLARPVGYHNRYVLKKLLGLSEKDIKRLEKEGVIGYWDNVVGLRPPCYYDIERDPIFNYKEGEE